MRSCAILLAAAACSRPPTLHDDPQAIAYRSRSKVPDAPRGRIAAEAVGDARRRPAWSEPNHVHAAGGPSATERTSTCSARPGSTSASTRPNPEVPRGGSERRRRHGYADALFTVQQLQEWASATKFPGDVQLHRSRGRVEASGPDAAARKLLAELSTPSGRHSAAGRRTAAPPGSEIPRSPLASFCLRRSDAAGRPRAWTWGAIECRARAFMVCVPPSLSRSTRGAVRAVSTR